MFKVDDIPDQVLRDIAGAYHRRLTSTDTESQPVDERDFQRTCYLRTALEWLALWLKQQPAPGIDDVIEKIVEYGGHRENEGGSYATFQKSEARRYRAEADEVLEEVRAMLAAPAAQAAADDVVRDAARYRWLRVQHWNDSKLCVVTNPTATVRLGTDLPSEGRLDAAIDAAMLAAQQQSGGE